MVSVLPGSYVNLLTDSNWQVCCHFADNFLDQFAVKLMVSG